MEKSNQSKEKTQQQDAQKQSAWKDSSPEDVTGKQPNPNKAMGNAANRAHNQDQKSKSGPTKMNENDSDEMGSGKRQDDN